MKDMLELLYEESERWCSGMQAENPDLTELTDNKNDTFDRLMKGMTPEQKDLFDTYFQLEGRITKILNYDNFRLAFHMGFQLTEELTKGKTDLLKKIENNL